MKKILKISSALFFAAIVLSTSCVSKKTYTALVNKNDESMMQYKELNKTCDDQIKNLNADIAQKRETIAGLMRDLAAKDSLLSYDQRNINALTRDNNYLKENNTNMLNRLSDLSVINKDGAESIRNSLKAINEQNSYIKDLNKSIQTKDSINLNLVMNLKRVLADINDDDVHVEVKKGVVYVSLSDKLLFKSGSDEINPLAFGILEKIARVLNDRKDLEILVQGHTDNVPIATKVFTDNWDLSAKRATAVVRLLQTKFTVDPQRMTAGGRSEYVPKADNSTPQGRQLNRRTEIILLPQLDQFFKLLEPAKNGSDK